MLAVDRLKRMSAALLRHSTSRDHSLTSSPPRAADPKGIQGQNDDGTLKVVRRHTPPPCYSAVVPISVVTSHGLHDDDVVTPTNDRCVTSSFGASVAPYRHSDGGDLRRNTLAPRNYFVPAAADTCNGMVNVNGVCFSVYGTLPRNLVRRRVKQGQGQGQSRVQSESDQVRTLERQPAPSPPKRTNSIKSDLERRLANDLDSTLTRRGREASSGDTTNDKTNDVYDCMRANCFRNNKPTGTEGYPSLEQDGIDAEKRYQVATTSRATDGEVSYHRGARAPSECGTNSVILDRKCCPETKPHHRKSHSISVAQDHRNRPDTASVSRDDVVQTGDQEFDGGTLKRRPDPPAATATSRPAEVEGQQVETDGGEAWCSDEQFDSDTVKRRLKTTQPSNNTHMVDSLTTGARFS